MHLVWLCISQPGQISCTAYVDLKPIRAGIAKTPEESDFTCAQHRIKAIRRKEKTKNTVEQFTGSNSEDIGLPFALADYQELVDWTGRILGDDKRGLIDQNIPPILDRLGLSRKNWAILTTDFESQFSHWVGAEETVRKVYKANKYQRIPSTKRYRTFLG